MEPDHLPLVLPLARAVLAAAEHEDHRVVALDVAQRVLHDDGDVDVAPPVLVRAEGVGARGVDADEPPAEDLPRADGELVEVGRDQPVAAAQRSLASGVVGSKSGLIRRSRSPRSAHSWYGDGRPQNQ